MIERDIDAVAVGAISPAGVAPEKLEVPETFIVAAGARGFASLAFAGRHAQRMPRLPRDPFDRMILAQALVEGVPPVTRDTRLGDCGVAVVRA